MLHSSRCTHNYPSAHTHHTQVHATTTQVHTHTTHKYMPQPPRYTHYHHTRTYHTNPKAHTPPPHKYTDKCKNIENKSNLKKIIAFGWNGIDHRILGENDLRLSMGVTPRAHCLLLWFTSALQPHALPCLHPRSCLMSVSLPPSIREKETLRRLLPLKDHVSIRG